MNVDSYTKFIKAHEQLVLIVGVLLIVYFLGSAWINHSAQVASAKADAATQVAKDAAEKSAQIESQVEVQESHYQALAATLATQNQSLVNAISKRDDSLQKDQARVKTEPLTAVASNWQSLAKLQPSDVQNTDSGLLVSDAGARATVSQLQMVPVLQSDLHDQRVITSNKDTQISGLTSTVSSLNQEVGGLKTQVADNTLACKAQTSAIKAEARKSKKSWFLRGLGIGAAVAGYILR